jgi:hypothetical protein
MCVSIRNDQGAEHMATDAELSRQIEQIKTKLVKLGDLRPGTLSEQYNTCRTPGCRCKADPPQKHGPYHQLSYTRHGRSRTENVRPEDLAAVRAQLNNYAELRDLVDQWIDTAIELDRLRRSQKRSAPRRRANH